MRAVRALREPSARPIGDHPQLASPAAGGGLPNWAAYAQKCSISFFKKNGKKSRRRRCPLSARRPAVHRPPNG
ncbi:hypothetical protein Nepgr_027903 [Nepenthes gracilis]|uniref:Uncharacterized protein n=1 Tax=Nepenthes gracilis TaxID=150966 RepID=A0AAD3T9C1_NEPGR|nr:hypothetical protein Nepgr_027903 [Nepenthes gracilis]